MKEQLSPEVKKAIEQVLSSLTETKVWPYVNIGKVIGDIEAKISPLRPPKGAIIRGGSIKAEDFLYFAVDDGVAEEEGGEAVWSWSILDHYRVIPTAQDALDLLQRLTRFGGSEGVVMAANLYKDAIQDLINHAMEG